MILRKPKGQELYDELCYVAKGISLNKLSLSDELMSKFDKNNIYKQECKKHEEEYRKTLKAIYKKALNEECSDLRKQMIDQDKGIKTIEETIKNKKNELESKYTEAIEKSISMYYEINKENIIYFDKRDICLLSKIKAFYENLTQIEIDCLLEHIRTFPNGLNPEGKLELLRNNGIKHSGEM